MINAIPLPLEGACNVRDLGGYKTKNTKTKYHAFLRSNKLRDITKDDRRYLLQYGVQCVIDLRSQLEKTNEPDNIRGFPVEYAHIPFRDFVYEAYSREEDVELFTVYKNLLDLCKNEIRAVFKKMAQYPEKTVLFHCSAGKDRTGVISMLLLSLCDVQKEDILRDYEVTEFYLSAIVKRKKEEWQSRGKVLPKYVYSSERGALEKTLCYLQNRYNSAYNYLHKNCGISNDTLQIIKNKLLCN